jgi:hypothetical protein
MSQLLKPPPNLKESAKVLEESNLKHSTQLPKENEERRQALVQALSPACRSRALHKTL